MYWVTALLISASPTGWAAGSFATAACSFSSIRRSTSVASGFSPGGSAANSSLIRRFRVSRSTPGFASVIRWIALFSFVSDWERRWSISVIVVVMSSTLADRTLSFFSARFRFSALTGVLGSPSRYSMFSPCLVADQTTPTRMIQGWGSGKG